MSKLLESIPWARRLKVRHLEVFLAVHDSGSLTAAAERLHMTQPALSHWLADVEDVIGRPLFVRGRRLQLTDDGEVLRTHALRMLGEVHRTHADLCAVRKGLSGRLHVGTGLPRVLVPRAIARMQHDRPGIFVSVVEAPFADLVAMLIRRDIDVIIGALTGEALRAGFASEALTTDRVQVVARRGHPLCRRKRCTWKDTYRYPWILPPAGAVMRHSFDEAFAAQGLVPPLPCVEAGSSIRLQLLMEEERDYLSILSALEVHRYRPLGIIDDVPLPPAISFPNIGAIWDKEREQPILDYFLGALRREASDLATPRP
jgi:DNA-binding transcriptional LysR family regulator